MNEAARRWIAIGLIGVAVVATAAVAVHAFGFGGAGVDPPHVPAASPDEPTSRLGSRCLGGNDTLGARAGFFPGELNHTMVVRETSSQNVSIDPTTALAVAALARGGVEIDPADFYDREHRHAEVCEVDRLARIDPDTVTAVLAIGAGTGSIVEAVGEARRFVLVEHLSFARVRIDVETALAALALDRATDGEGVDPLAIATFDKDETARRVDERTGRLAQADALLAVAYNR